MTANEYIELFLKASEESVSGQMDEKAAIELSDVISGSFVYVLVERITQFDLDAEVIAGHLENLYDGGDCFGFIYFVMLLAEATDTVLPRAFYKLSVKKDVAEILSAAILEDWLEATE